MSKLLKNVWLCTDPDCRKVSQHSKGEEPICPACGGYHVICLVDDGVMIDIDDLYNILT